MLIVDNNMNGTKNIVLFYKGRYIFAQIAGALVVVTV